jgi:glycerol-3-phosphate cytidylyltransferase-like family protein
MSTSPGTTTVCVTAGGGAKRAKLFVVVARDRNAKRLKGKTPFFSEVERKKLLSGLRSVDEVVLGGKRDLFAVLQKVKPDVIVLGFDQRVNESLLKKKIREFGLAARVVRLRSAFKPRRHKSGVLKKYFGL